MSGGSPKEPRLQRDKLGVVSEEGLWGGCKGCRSRKGQEQMTPRWWLHKHGGQHFEVPASSAETLLRAGASR